MPCSFYFSTYNPNILICMVNMLRNYNMADPIRNIIS